MKLELDLHSGNRNLIAAYSDEGITIRETLYRTSIIVGRDQLVPDWSPASLQELMASHWEPAIALQPEIILLGTGATLVFPEAEVLVPLLKAGISYEIMDTPAACRTYNLITGDGRQVVAALLSMSGRPA